MTCNNLAHNLCCVWGLFCLIAYHPKTHRQGTFNDTNTQTYNEGVVLNRRTNILEKPLHVQFMNGLAGINRLLELEPYQWLNYSNKIPTWSALICYQYHQMNCSQLIIDIFNVSHKYCNYVV